MKQLFMITFVGLALIAILYGLANAYPLARDDALTALEDRHIIAREMHVTFGDCHSGEWSFAFRGVQARSGVSQERLEPVSGHVCVGGLEGARVSLSTH